MLKRPEPRHQPYGDLSLLNIERPVLDSVGPEALQDLVDDYLDMLQTSSAVYERNSDYAEGIFTSGWCRRLNNASRELRATDDNRAALQDPRFVNALMHQLEGEMRVERLERGTRFRVLVPVG